MWRRFKYKFNTDTGCLFYTAAFGFIILMWLLSIAIGYIRFLILGV